VKEYTSPNTSDDITQFYLPEYSRTPLGDVDRTYSEKNPTNYLGNPEKNTTHNLENFSGEISEDSEEYMTHDLGNYSSGEKISEITPEFFGREISTKTPELSTMEMSTPSLLGNISADPPPKSAPKKRVRWYYHNVNDIRKKFVDDDDDLPENVDTKEEKKLVWKEYNRARENSKRRKTTPQETFLGAQNLVGNFPQNPT